MNFCSSTITHSILTPPSVIACLRTGTLWMIGSVLNLLVYPAVVVTNEYEGGNYRGFALFLLALCLPMFVSIECVLKPALEKAGGSATRPLSEY